MTYLALYFFPMSTIITCFVSGPIITAIPDLFSTGLTLCLVLDASHLAHTLKRFLLKAFFGLYL